MLAKTMKWGVVVSLLLAAMSWNGGSGYQLLLGLAVSVGAIVVVLQSVRAKEYLWASGFIGMAVLLNPIVQVFTHAGNLLLLMFLVCVSPFVIARAAWMDATAVLHPSPVVSRRSRGGPPLPAIEWGIA